MILLLKNIRLSPFSSEKEAIGEAYKKVRHYLAFVKENDMYVYRMSVDARHRDRITKVWSVAFDTHEEVFDEELLIRLDASVLKEGKINIEYGDKKTEYRPVIVGFGPAGMFCALVLAENGYRPIVLERGDRVEKRKEKVSLFTQKGILDTNTNVQFGEGGAGTFSDGKLVTRINDEKCRYILECFYKFGADKSVLTNAKPHIGTDKLEDIVRNIRNRITENGGEILFNTVFLGSVKRNGNIIAFTDKGEIPCSSLVLAIGHSARDTYKILAQSGFEMIQKPFSVGVRIEQDQKRINSSIYGKFADILGNADYNFSYRKGSDAVYTFCMCPGGQVVCAASEEEGVVVNGMSSFARDGENSNSALVVSVSGEDFGHGLFDGMDFQRKLEKAAFELGGNDYSAPVQLVKDYKNRKISTSFGKIKPTYGSGRTRFADLNSVFPEKVNCFLKEGLCRFEKSVAGFAPDDAVLTGVETRTSSPLRILRNEIMESTFFEDIYPCGEGAGYAGGITSAALDGVKTALAIMKKYKPF